MNRKNTRNAGMEQFPEDRQAMIDALAAALVNSAQQNGQKENQIRSDKPEPKTIDLVALFYFLLSKIIYIIIAAVIGAALLGYRAASNPITTYTATAKLYIVGDQGISIISDLQLGNMLKLDYEEVFRTWEVHEMVREELGLNYSYSQMQSMLTVTNPEDTRILYIAVRNNNAQLAADIANAYARAAKEFILQTMDTDEPNIFSVALVPSIGASSSPRKQVVMGFLLGSVLMVAILVLFFVCDDRPRSPEDIANVAGIPTLATIPAAKGSNKRRMMRKMRGSGYYYDAY